MGVQRNAVKDGGKHSPLAGPVVALKPIRRSPPIDLLVLDKCAAKWSGYQPLVMSSHSLNVVGFREPHYLNGAGSERGRANQV